MDGLSDEETRVIPTRATKNPQNNTFDIDDAFDSDGDGPDPQFDFSSAAVREEIARNRSWIEAQHDSDEDGDGAEVQSSNGWDGTQDTSVSTIDIGGPASVLGSRGSRTEDSLHSNDFSQVSLSEHEPPELSHSPSPSPAEREPAEGDGAAHPYPVVHIDVSQPPPSRVELAPIRVSYDSYPGSRLSLPSQEHPPTMPRSAPATSSSHSFDIPIPESSSLPLPPTPTSATFSHRPTRSMGPSALEKVISKTRPAFLPPKSKQEDNKHMADWERMMKLSRAAGTCNAFSAVPVSNPTQRRRGGRL